MKKKLLIIIVLVVIIFAICMIYCNKPKNVSDSTKQVASTSANSFIQYQDNGYTYNGFGCEGDSSTNMTLKIWFNSSDKKDCVLISAVLTEQEKEKYDEIDILSETYEEDKQNFLASIPESEITVTNLDDKIPTEAEVNSYVGKTLGDLENDGYEWYTDEDDENGDSVRIYWNEETNVLLAISIEGGTPDLFELTNEEVSALKITKAQFWGLEG